MIWRLWALSVAFLGYLWAVIIFVNTDLTPVPEPACWAFVLMGFAAGVGLLVAVRYWLDDAFPETKVGRRR